jgi:hypothetical protein
LPLEECQKLLGVWCVTKAGRSRGYGLACSSDCRYKDTSKFSALTTTTHHRRGVKHLRAHELLRHCEHVGYQLLHMHEVMLCHTSSSESSLASPPSSKHSPSSLGIAASCGESPQAKHARLGPERLDTAASSSRSKVTKSGHQCSTCMQGWACERSMLMLTPLRCITVMALVFLLLSAPFLQVRQRSGIWQGELLSLVIVSAVLKSADATSIKNPQRSICWLHHM